MEYMWLTCWYCGARFLKNTTGRLKRYCNPKCKNTMHYEKNKLYILDRQSKYDKKNIHKKKDISAKYYKVNKNKIRNRILCKKENSP